MQLTKTIVDEHGVSLLHCSFRIIILRVRASESPVRMIEVNPVDKESVSFNSKILLEKSNIPVNRKFQRPTGFRKSGGDEQLSKSVVSAIQ